jgi:hypothetical protein
MEQELLNFDLEAKGALSLLEAVREGLVETNSWRGKLSCTKLPLNAALVVCAVVDVRCGTWRNKRGT